MSRTGFRLMDPAKSLQQRLAFVRQLHDREALLPRERQRRFLEAEGWVAWPGPVLADVIRQFGVHNRLVSGGFVIGDRLVTLADMTCPILAFVGESDEIAPARSVRAARWAAPLSEVYEVSLKAGHFGLVVGSTAVENTWPTVAAWTKWRADGGELPAGVERIEEEIPEPTGGPSTLDRLTTGAQLAIGTGVGAAQAFAGAAFGASRTIRELAGDTAGQLDQLNRLGRVGARTRISLGLLLDEQAERAPDDVIMLFEDRAHTQMAVKERVDNVVRGLIEIGVRQGEHVGVLMQTRPSALTIVSALSRLGAVAVLMRPDGDPAREAELGRVARIIADPQNAEAAAASTGLQIYVLGGGGKERKLGRGLIDMERIDPGVVEIPAWHKPNPGLAGDLAFILFTGSGERTTANRITNRRWALSAFGTASSASLTSSDTIYSASPVYHPSALLMSVGGVIAGGARLAVASEYDPATFWEEVRRYGATVVSYTWAMLDEIAEAPPNPAEDHHPVRLFMGSGMPSGLWRRVRERFAPANVLEFYASTEGDAVLVNISGAKPGCKGRPLPGSAEVRIAAYDPVARRLVLGRDGYAISSAKHETGMLLAQVRRDAIGMGDGVLRGVFESGDAWLETGDLFRRDVDGDFWLVDHASALIRTNGRVVYSGPIQDALGQVEAIALSVAYGVPTRDGSSQIPCVAVTVREGCELDVGELETAMSDLGDAGIPQVIRAVDEIPLTTWFRAQSGPLRAGGDPGADEAGDLLVLGPAQGRVPADEQGGRGAAARHRPLTRCPAAHKLPGRMAELTITHHIAAPVEAVFDTLTDARRYPDYTPIRRVDMEIKGEGDPNGVGAVRALHLIGPPTRERVLVHEPPERFEFEVLSGPPVRRYIGRQTFEPEGAGTRVTYAIELDPRVPGTGLAVAAGVRGAVELLMRLADREARGRAAASGSKARTA